LASRAEEEDILSSHDLDILISLWYLYSGLRFNWIYSMEKTRRRTAWNQRGARGCLAIEMEIDPIVMSYPR
jgi:hypothetical protein